MRRILLAAFALLLLHAAPSMAAECTNLALAGNGGVASVSSRYSETANHAPTLLNDARRQPTWRDGTANAYPDWAQIEWDSPRQINRIIVRGPIWQSSASVGGRTLARVRVQWYDDVTSAWVDVVDTHGRANPILDWVTPLYTSDGSEIRQLDLATITTSRIRVLFDQGSLTDGYARLDEIEAYYRDQTCAAPGEDLTNLALEGAASASSVHSSGSYPATGVNNDAAESGASRGYWNDDTNGIWPDWVQVAWTQPVLIDRIVARIPLARWGFPAGEITLRSTRIQYWDDARSSWTDVVDSDAESNPIVDWTGPIDVADGTERKVFDFEWISTTRIRALIEGGSSDGWSWLDELAAYCVVCARRGDNLALSTNGGVASVSSRYTNTSNHSPTLLNDGGRQPTWRDGTYNTYPDWAQIQWGSPRTLNRIVLRGPIWQSSAVEGVRTLARTRVQWYDDSASDWVDVVDVNGLPNPILDWVNPLFASDGSEIRQLDLATVRTSRIRVLFEEGSTDGYSRLDEIEAYWVSWTDRD